MCCMPETLWTVDLVNSKEGKCCPTGTAYSFDSVVGKGKCCPAGESFEGGCPPTGTLGIRYGRCYTMSDFDGNQFTRGFTDWNYSLGTQLVKSIVFRICANTDNCTSQQDQYVPEGGFWYHHDQTGVPGRAETSFVGVYASILCILYKNHGGQNLRENRPAYSVMPYLP